jgi:hypothetical protein
MVTFELTLGGLYVKHAVQCGILGTNSAFALGPRKTTENLDRNSRVSLYLPFISRRVGPN